MQASPDVKQLESVKRHRRQTLLWLALPMLGVSVGLIVLVMALVVPGSPIQLRQAAQVGIIADWMLIWFVLCPVVLCLFPIFVVLMAAFWGTSWVHHGTSRGLRRVQVGSRSIAEKAAAAAEKINRGSIGLNARFAFLDQLLNLLMRDPAQGGEKDHDTTRK